MDEARDALALFLVLNVLAGLVRISRGPTLPDRFLVTQLFGTTGVALLLLLREQDAALALALLAGVTTAALVRTVPPSGEGP